MSLASDDPGDDGVRELLARAALEDTMPARSGVRGAMKRVRLRRHGIEHINESFEGIGQIFRGLATLWSAEKDSDV